MKNNKKYLISLVAMGIIFVALAVFVINREWIFDFWRGVGYEPSAELSGMRDNLTLTDRGKFLFNASRPELKGRDDFNEMCRSDEDTETAVLGCYTDKTIYVYDIVDEELKGIRELTLAHELLHAVWARMSEAEKKGLRNDLAQVLKENEDALRKEIENYESSDREEELYVRAGTEIKDLPEKLEKHYADVFQNQDRIVEFYNSYIEVFRKLEAEMDSLMAEMEEIEAMVMQKSEDYKQRTESLDHEVEAFNNCANTAGCFVSEGQFRARRNELLAKSQALNELYDEIDGLINKYNEDVEKYNSDVLHNNRLIKIVNSNESVEEIE